MPRRHAATKIGKNRRVQYFSCLVGDVEISPPNVVLEKEVALCMKPYWVSPEAVVYPSIPERKTG